MMIKKDTSSMSLGDLHLADITADEQKKKYSNHENN